jgi:hypothetical protein
MGDLFSSTQSSQSSTNQAVGVQGGSGATNTATHSSVQANAGQASAVLSNSSVAGGVTLQSLDPAALEIAHEALIGAGAAFHELLNTVNSVNIRSLETAQAVTAGGMQSVHDYQSLLGQTQPQNSGSEISALLKWVVLGGVVVGVIAFIGRK